MGHRRWKEEGEQRRETDGQICIYPDIGVRKEGRKEITIGKREGGNRIGRVGRYVIKG